MVLMDTQAHRALDVFYVSENGKKLLPERMSGLKEGEALFRSL